MSKEDIIIVLGTVDAVGDPPPVPSMRQYCMICGTDCWMSDAAYRFWEQGNFMGQLLCTMCVDGLPDPPDEVRAVPGSGITKRQLKWIVERLFNKPNKENNNG